MTFELPQPLAWICHEQTLLGMLHKSIVKAKTAVIIVPGGSQYRVGAHRGFVDLAEKLAAGGYPTLRFDVRGMGDSTGHHPGFTNLTDDIASAIAAIKAADTSITRVVLWGLCDGATAALLAADCTSDIDGLILCNTWVRTVASEAATVLNHHYKGRLRDIATWQRLFKGEIDIVASLKSVFGSVATIRSTAPSDTDLLERVTSVWNRYKKPVLSVIGEKDFTGAEFARFVKVQQPRDNVTIKNCANGDHSFSGAETGAALATACLEWLALI